MRESSSTIPGTLARKCEKKRTRLRHQQIMVGPYIIVLDTLAYSRCHRLLGHLHSPVGQIVKIIGQFVHGRIDKRRV